jgi:hypothetical protein
MPIASSHHRPAALLDDSGPLPVDRPFTSGQASALGVTRRRLAELVSLNLLRRPIRSVYVAAQVPDSRQLRRQVLELVGPPGSVVSDWAACWYWTGIDRPNADLSDPALSVLRFRGRDRLRNGLVSSGQRWFLPDDVAPLGGGLYVTTPIRTAWDLGRFFPPVVALGGMDALARLGMFTVAELCDGIERFRRQRGVVQLRVLAPIVDGRAESPGESALRWRWLEIPGLPKPDLQISVRSDAGIELFRIDLGVDELLFGAEYDGEEWHGPDSAAHDHARRQRLDREFGWSVEVFRRADVYGQRHDAGRRLQESLLAARHRLGLFHPVPRGLNL